MTPAEIYDLLVSKGYIVGLDGESFIVCLSRRPVTADEIRQVLGYPEGLQYAREGIAVVVWYV